MSPIIVSRFGRLRYYGWFCTDDGTIIERRRFTVRGAHRAAMRAYERTLAA